MKLFYNLEKALQKFTKPLDYIEAVVASVILLSLVVLLSNMNSNIDNLGPVLRVLINENLVWFLIAILVPTLCLHIYAYFCARSERSLKIRSASLFIYTVLYLFLSVMAYFHYGAGSLAWIQTVSLALITGIVYLHVRVHLRYGEQR